jgi:predicted  nucleic acid-binding Zn-ribbon protein
MTAHIENIGILRQKQRELEAVTSLLAVVENLGQIDQTIEVAQARIAAVRAEENAARDKVQAVLVELDQAKQAASDADAYAIEVEKRAKAQAERIIADANSERDRVAALIDQDREAANAVVALTENALKKLNEQIASATAELAAINERIEQAKAAARAAFGGEAALASVEGATTFVQTSTPQGTAI